MRKVITIIAYDDTYEDGHILGQQPVLKPCVRYGIVENERHVELVKEDIKRHGGRYIQTHKVEIVVEPDDVPLFYTEEVE